MQLPEWGICLIYKYSLTTGNFKLINSQFTDFENLLVWNNSK
jgi:hypothetical protein